MEPYVLRYAEAARYIGVSERQLDKFIKAELIPTVRLSTGTSEGPGRIKGVRRLDLELYADARLDAEGGERIAGSTC